jgi:hypothetical protein
MTIPAAARPGRNDPCHCGSGRKYKHCCLAKDEAESAAARKAAADAEPAPVAESTANAPRRQPRAQTPQPWKAKSNPGFAKRVRAPRKAGGS